MRRLIGKVIDPPSPLHATCSSTDFILLTRIAFTTKLDAAEKELVEERAAQQVTTLTRDMQFVHASVDAIKEELSTKSATLDEVVMREHDLGQTADSR
jgi:uncharacterized protein YoxC